MNDFLVKIIETIVNPLILFLFALAVVYFLYGMIKCFMSQEKEESKGNCRNHMLWGILGIVIMMGVWFWMGLIIRTLNVEGIDVDNGHIKVDVTL